MSVIDLLFVPIGIYEQKHAKIAEDNLLDGHVYASSTPSSDRRVFVLCEICNIAYWTSEEVGVFPEEQKILGYWEPLPEYVRYILDPIDEYFSFDTLHNFYCFLDPKKFDQGVDHHDMTTAILYGSTQKIKIKGSHLYECRRNTSLIHG